MAAELAHRIQADNQHFGGTMPEATAISWRGYLAAMLEWSLIPVGAYDERLTHIRPSRMTLPSHLLGRA